MSKAQIIALCAAVAAVSTLGFASAVRANVVLYNHTPSIPPGFYLRSEEVIGKGSIVTVLARDVAPAAARQREFDGDDDRFIKRVAAVGGQLVCGEGEALFVDGREVARRYAPGASAPAIWDGCRTLRHDEVLLLGDSADSFDGRYWGPVSIDVITGVWRPISQGASRPAQP